MALEDSQEREELLQVVQVFIAFFAAEFGVRFAPQFGRSRRRNPALKPDTDRLSYVPSLRRSVKPFWTERRRTSEG